jgi:hypothetical protein
MDFNSILSFGKYKGKTIEYVYKHDAQYLAWMMEHTNYLKLSFKDRLKILKKAEKDQLLQFNWDYN